MLLNALVLLTSLMPITTERAEALLRAAPTTPAATTPAEPAPRFDSATRSVSNWHAQTGAQLTPRALALTASLAEDPPYVARCVRLNNGWCIKSARWPGEIGADAEGHTAFATLDDGADAAASLLRRYYRDYNRHTALAIVRRWAPAECRVASASRGGKTPAVSAALAPRGLGGTLRARFLAKHRPGGAPRGRTALRVQPWSPLARMAGRPARRPTIPHVAALRPIPSIASDITPSARPARTVADPAALLDRKTDGRVPSADRLVAESALLPAIAAGLPVLDLRLPAPLCTGDETRIQAYAARISGSVGLKPGDDLDLFGPDGAPRANLAPVMLAMSAVELGTLRAGPDLVAGAIARLRPLTPAAGGTPP
ncbi:hypothetical protein SAMN05216360_105290 [Methylobacterium phyllostachyos]|uniref:Uncharacterized protein n=1 Tax=Methylobacterium phyllostachyos TaxID=582672 RepID=A0A1G9YGB1_9HYPH|nr:hypothetical protein [Methylobacterium phyllostachyos]SDN07586.1 hypothetical protein SAMN05216360_105290 [Methylobacterium phyllostachyos]